MDLVDRSGLTPLVVLVDADDLSIADVLRAKEYVVVRASTGRQALDLISKVSPDAVLVNARLPDVSTSELLQELGQSSSVGPTTPLIVIAQPPIGKARRLDAFAAGAWHILEDPLDVNELILRLDTFIRVKQGSDQIRDEGLTDPMTGLYNIRGVLRRVREVTADATRSGRALTCVAFGSKVLDALPTASDRPPRDSESLADALSKLTRTSDTLGQLGEDEFIIIAPGTDQDGAIRLADRILQQLRVPGAPDHTEAVRAGIYAADAPIETPPEDLLLRATVALRQAQADDQSFRVRTYEA